MSDTGSQDRREFPMAGTESTGSQQLGAVSSAVVAAHPVQTDQPTVISQRTPIPGPLTASSSPAELGRTLLGQKLDHFELLEYVGGGGMGAVFKALDTRLNRIVALKVLARDHADEEEKVRRFQNEAQSAARLDHDHIARVYFVGQDCGLHYIVFEYIEGINLRELVERKGPLQIDEAISFTLQIAEALSHASSRDVVHRDIKPSNVLITPQGRAKLVDMGLARLHQVEHSQNDLTSSGVTLGTFDYISPEQARDPRSADVRSDIYSLGCTLYFMLTGRPPFPEGNVLQKLLQHNNDPPPDPADYYPELPEVISRLVAKMLAKDPRKRHQRASELVADLLAIFDQLGLSVQGLDTIPWVAPKPFRFGRYQRHLPWIAPLALLLGFVAAIDIWSSTLEVPELEVTRRATPLSQARSSLPSLDRESAASIIGKDDDAERDSASATPTTPLTQNGSDADVANVAPTRGAETSLSQQPVVAVTPADSRAESPQNVIDLSAAGGLALVPQGDPIALHPGLVTTASIVSAASNDVARTIPQAPASPHSEIVKPGVLVVNPSGKSPHEYTSLRQACAVAKEKGIDVIELQFNGAVEEKPIRLDNQKLTIRAAENCQPTVVFRPKSIGATESQPMISIVGGQLALINVAIEFDVAKHLQPLAWALFETQRPESVRLERCSLTIRNANEQRMAMHPDVAFFDIKAPPDSTAMAMNNPMAADPSIDLQFDNCIMRGEATLLRTLQMQPVKLAWNNGLLATSERLLLATGGDMPPRQGGIIALDLRHVTVVADAGLCRLSNAEGDRQSPLLHTEITCADSILMCDGNQPLIEQIGSSAVGEFEEQFHWSGTRYFYADVDVFWRITTLSSQGSSQTGSYQPVVRRFEDWQLWWDEPQENAGLWAQVKWKRLPDARPYHAHTPLDYALAEPGPDNGARAGAADGLDAGLKAGELPPLPSPPLTDPSTPPPPTAAGAAL